MQRIDRLITPPGWIARAQMYSLVFDGDNLYVLNTGKAANPTQLFNPMELYRSRAELIQAGYDGEIKEREGMIANGGPDSLLGVGKSARYTKAEIEELKLGESAFKGDYILLKAGGKKYTLVFERGRKGEAEDFVKGVK